MSSETSAAEARNRVPIPNAPGKACGKPSPRAWAVAFITSDPRKTKPRISRCGNAAVSADG